MLLSEIDFTKVTGAGMHVGKGRKKTTYSVKIKLSNGKVITKPHDTMERCNATLKDVLSRIEYAQRNSQ